MIVDYRGLMAKLDSAMEMYSGSGLEELDSEHLKGAVIDVVVCVSRL